MNKIWAGIAAAVLLSSCQEVQGWFGKNEGADSTQRLQSADAHEARLQRDVSITRANAYSDLFLDSSMVENYIRREGLPADAAGRMRAFYRVRNDQFAWFSSAGPTEQARGLWSLYESRADSSKQKNNAALREHMDSLLTRDSAFIALRAGASAGSDTARGGSTDSSMADSTLVQTELALTAQLVQLAGKEGVALTADNFYWVVPRKKMDALELADSLLHRADDSSLWQGNRTWAGLRQQLRPYYEAARGGGWPALGAAPGLRAGSRSPAVSALKKRLAATGDYPAGDTSDRFSDTLATALRAVQQQFGLQPTGALNDSLLRELNMPAEARVQQLLVNMNRALWLPPATDSSRIEINVPAQELLVWSDTGLVMSMPVIVGKEGSGTVAFSDRISTVVFNPYWNVPEGIVRREIMPALKRDPAYLRKKNMEVLGGSDSLPRIRQLPGKDNALGRVKFLFPNSFDIYLHDTPHKELFSRQDRALSNGCIRVARPDSLAAYILRGQGGWTPQKITAAMNGGGEEEQVAVKRPVPVSISYLTAWTAADGKLRFRRDVYGYDRGTAALMFGTPGVG